MKKHITIAIIFISFCFMQGCLPGLAANYKLGKYDKFTEGDKPKTLCQEIQLIASSYGLEQKEKLHEETICNFSDDRGVASLSVSARKYYGEVLVTINTTGKRGRDKEFQDIKKQVETMLSRKFPNFEVKS